MQRVCAWSAEAAKTGHLVLAAQLGAGKRWCESECKETGVAACAMHAIAALHDPQSNASIQPAMARPFSCGESSWTKCSPATVTSVCAGKLRAKSRLEPPAMS